MPAKIHQGKESKVYLVSTVHEAGKQSRTCQLMIHNWKIFIYRASTVSSKTMFTSSVMAYIAKLIQNKSSDLDYSLLSSLRRTWTLPSGVYC